MSAPIELAAAFVADAAGQLRLWAAKETDAVAGASYVAAGHQAIREIDEAIHALHEARQALIGEIRVDDEERAIRVDLMLAGYRAARLADDERDAKPVVTTAHEGYALGGRADR